MLHEYKFINETCGIFLWHFKTKKYIGVAKHQSFSAIQNLGNIYYLEKVPKGVIYSAFRLP